jgi:hypothetical protein
MKKVFPFLVLSFLMFVQSCSFTDSKVENDLTKENLKGDVILVYQVGDDGGSSLEIFNDNGMLTKGFFGKKGEYYDYKEVTYEKDKKIQEKRIGDWGRGGFFEIDYKYSYNPNGKLESLTFNDNKLFCSYNEDGKLVRETSESSYSTSIKDYYYSSTKLDSIIDVVTYKSHNDKSLSIEKINGVNQVFENYDLKDDGNRVLTTITYRKNNESGDIIEEVRTEFDPKGNKTKITTIKYEYNYDEKGNWVQKRIIENGELEGTYSRTIVYKGGETGIYISEMEKILSSFNVSNNSNNSTQDDGEIESNVPIPSTNNYEQSSGSRGQEVKSKCSTCNGSGKCRECGKTFRKQYYKGNGSYESRNESRPGLVMCNDCFGRGHRQVKRTGGGWEPGEDCYVSGCEDGWRYCRECNNYGNGKNIGQCQSCKGTGFRN